jgi:L-galactose dehydrogenase
MRKARLGNTDLHLSTLGYGAGALAGGYGDAAQNEANAAVARAVECGINFFDTAPFYSSKDSKSEDVLGIALSQLTVPRSSYIVNTKCARFRDLPFDFTAGRAKSTVEESLRRLRVDYLDMITVHDVEFADSLDQVVNETVPALRELQQEGKVRYVGVSGYPLNVLLHVAQRVKLDFVLTYCHYTLQNQLLEEYLPAFEALGCGVINAAPISMRFFSEIGPPEWHPATAAMRAVVPQLNKMCKDKGTNLSKVAVQFAVHSPLAASGRFACTLTGMATPKEVDVAVETLQGPADAGLVKDILEVMKPHKNYDWPSGNSAWVSLPGPSKK